MVNEWMTGGEARQQLPATCMFLFGVSVLTCGFLDHSKYLSPSRPLAAIFQTRDVNLQIGAFVALAGVADVLFDLPQVQALLVSSQAFVDVLRSCRRT